MDPRYLEQLSYGEDPDPEAGFRAFFPTVETAQDDEQQPALSAQEAADRALKLLDREDAFLKAPIALGPRLGPDLDAALAQLGQPAPRVAVRC